MTRQIILASGNPGKLREFKQMLEPAGYIVSPQSEYHVNEADEPYFSFVENALNKARHVSGLTGKPALADDSGLCADALGGSPGVLSARYAGEPKSDLRSSLPIWLPIRTRQPIFIVFWFMCVRLMIHSRLLPMANGLVKLSMCQEVKTVSDMILISGYLNCRKRQQNYLRI